MNAWLITGIAYLLLAAWIVRAVIRAPIAKEDDHGFHEVGRGR